jgi:hypothetical protein
VEATSEVAQFVGPAFLHLLHAVHQCRIGSCRARCKEEKGKPGCSRVGPGWADLRVVAGKGGPAQVKDSRRRFL